MLVSCYIQGMDSIHLVEYMAWVPIVGSAFGNVLGGFVSDYFIGRKTPAGSRQSSADSNIDGSGHKADRTTNTLRDVLLLPGASKTATAVSDRHASAASTCEDSVSKDDSQSRQGIASHLFEASHSSRHSARDPVAVDQSLRMLIAGWSNILPVPLIICALLLEFPYCFLIMIASGMVSVCVVVPFLLVVCDLVTTFCRVQFRSSRHTLFADNVSMSLLFFVGCVLLFIHMHFVSLI